MLTKLLIKFLGLNAASLSGVYCNSFIDEDDLRSKISAEEVEERCAICLSEFFERDENQLNSFQADITENSINPNTNASSSLMSSSLNQSVDLSKIKKYFTCVNSIKAHAFHLECILRSFKTNFKCPICKICNKNVLDNNLEHLLDNLIEHEYQDLALVFHFVTRDLFLNYFYKIPNFKEKYEFVKSAVEKSSNTSKNLFLIELRKQYDLYSIFEMSDEDFFTFLLNNKVTDRNFIDIEKRITDSFILELDSINFHLMLITMFTDLNPLKNELKFPFVKRILITRLKSKKRADGYEIGKILLRFKEIIDSEVYKYILELIIEYFNYLTCNDLKEILCNINLEEAAVDSNLFNRLVCLFEKSPLLKSSILEILNSFSEHFSGKVFNCSSKLKNFKNSYERLFMAFIKANISHVVSEFKNIKKSPNFHLTAKCIFLTIKDDNDNLQKFVKDILPSVANKKDVILTSLFCDTFFDILITKNFLSSCIIPSKQYNTFLCQLFNSENVRNKKDLQFLIDGLELSINAGNMPILNLIKDILLSKLTAEGDIDTFQNTIIKLRNINLTENIIKDFEDKLQNLKISTNIKRNISNISQGSESKKSKLE